MTSGDTHDMPWRPDDVGSCHACETMQLFRDAAWVPSPYAGVVEGQPKGPGPAMLLCVRRRRAVGPRRLGTTATRLLGLPG